MDKFLAIVLLIVLSPVFLLIAFALKISPVKAVFFVHQRPGKNNKPFHLYKFKTMNEKRDSHGKLLPNMQRITPLGAFLRKTSLDEIPQLLNVLLGELSLVGPRPLEMRYLPYYTKEQSRRHEVRPGITGWAQINGRNNLSWEKKFKLDVWYVENISFMLDMKILLLTFKKVFVSEGVNANPTATVEPLDVYLNKKS